MKKITQLAMAAVAVLLFGCAATSSRAATLYVALPTATPPGTSAGPGDIAHPYATIGQALNKAQALGTLSGSTINLRGGTYNLTSSIYIGPTLSGTSGAPVTIQSYSGEWAKLSFSSFATTATFFVNASYIKMQNFEIQNSQGYGIYIVPTTGGGGVGCSVIGCYVSGCQKSGIRMDNATSTLIDNCHVWNTCLMNSARTLSGGWPSAVDGYNCVSTEVRYCTVYDNYGEGIGFNGGDQINIHGNSAVHDNYSVNIYVNSDTNVTVDSNTCNSLFHTSYYRGGNPAVGIGLANERSDVKLNNITISNNIIWDGKNGISFWGGGNGGTQLFNTHITGNKVHSSWSYIVYMDQFTPANPGTNGNTYITGNTYYQNGRSLLLDYETVPHSGNVGP